MFSKNGLRFDWGSFNFDYDKWTSSLLVLQVLLETWLFPTHSQVVVVVLPIGCSQQICASE